MKTWAQIESMRNDAEEKIADGKELIAQGNKMLADADAAEAERNAKELADEEAEAKRVCGTGVEE